MAEKFVIDSPQKADWAIRKLFEHKKNIREHEETRDAFVAEYTQLIEQAKKACTENCANDVKAVENLEYLLREFAESNLPYNKHTYKLPSGKLIFRKRLPNFYLVHDNSAPSATNKELYDVVLRNFDAETRNKFLKTEVKKIQTVDWAALKKELEIDPETGDVTDKDGQLIEGLKGEFLPDKFDVKPSDFALFIGTDKDPSAFSKFAGADEDV